MNELTITGWGWKKHCDFVSAEQINYLPKLKDETLIIDLHNTDKSWYLRITEFNNFFIIRSPTVFFFNVNHSLVLSYIVNRLIASKKQDTKAFCPVSMAEPSHMPKHPRIGPEVQIHGLNWASGGGEFMRPWKFCSSPWHSIKTMYLNFQPYTWMFWPIPWLTQAHVTNRFPPHSIEKDVPELWQGGKFMIAKTLTLLWQLVQNFFNLYKNLYVILLIIIF